MEKLYAYLDMMKVYTHYGDQRYLTSVEPGANDAYPEEDRRLKLRISHV